MKKLLYLVLCLFLVSCVKDNNPLGEIDENTDYFSKRTIKPKAEWNALDYLCDTIQREFGVEIIYEYTPRIISGNTFFMPPQYDKALPYTRTMLYKMWLQPLKQSFPKFFNTETPIEFILAGGFIHFNDPTLTATAAGAGMNAQFYRLGMGGVNNYSTNKTWLQSHLVTLYHEHAHQIDHKYGRGDTYDRISQGKYYGLAGYRINPKTGLERTDAESQADGFFKSYGGYAPEEDWATSVEYMVRYPESTIKTFVARSVDLDKKYRIVYQRYLDMGVDLHKLQGVVDSVVFKVNY
ncbi:putative zinc-binding metallopeptidase [Sphingobacterium sp. Mn56C]|uniref:putative zinc-binding metallopeptidase n=1 Tax=Sphingobacterium sp. Mn56C TaxID=3395261 RepID=UPI003BD2F599